MRPVRVRAQIIKIADCVRIAVFFFTSSRCYSFHSPRFHCPRGENSTRVNFLERFEGEILGTRSFYSAINFIPGANVTRYRGFCKYYRARSLQAGNIDCNVMRTWVSERVDFRWKITSLVWLPPRISRVVKAELSGDTRAKMLRSKIVVVGSIIYIPCIQRCSIITVRAPPMPYIPIDVGIDYRLINMQNVVSRIKVIFTCKRKSIKPLFDIVKREISREWETILCVICLFDDRNMASSY